MIDDEDLQRTTGRFQLESRLLQHGCEDVGPGLKAWLATFFWRRKSGIRELQLEIAGSLRSGLIEDRARQRSSGAIPSFKKKTGNDRQGERCERRENAEPAQRWKTFAYEHSCGEREETEWRIHQP